MGKKKPGQKKPQAQAMSLDEFNKVTPASLTAKRTENLMPSAYTNLNLEAMPNVMANEGKQKKIIAPTQQQQEALQAENTQKQEIEIVSYEEATGNNLSDTLNLGQDKKKLKEEQKVEAPEEDGWETVGKKKAPPKTQKQSADPYKMAPDNRTKQTAQPKVQAPPKLPNPTGLQGMMSLPQPTAPVFNSGQMPMPPMPMPPMPNMQGGQPPVGMPQPPVFNPSSMPMPPMPNQPKPQPKAPLSLDQVMANVAQKGQQKLQEKQMKEQQKMAYQQQNQINYDQNQNDYGDEYYPEHPDPFQQPELFVQHSDPFVQHGDPFDIQKMESGQLSGMLNQLSLDPSIQQHFSGDQLAMFQNLTSHVGQGGNLNEFVPTGSQKQQQEENNSGYNPVYFVEDHDAQLGDQGEQVILQPTKDGGFKEVGKYQTFGTGQNRSDFGGMTKEQLVAIQFDEEIPDDDDLRIEQYLAENANKVMCQFFLAGNCNKGDQCSFLHPNSLQEEKGQKKTVRGYNKKDDHDCQVCMEPVLARGLQFGLLEGCDHTFCLKCIRSWRATYDKKTSKHHYRTCPICRASSYLVIPSFYVIRSGPEKDDLIYDYKDAIADMDCRHFQKGSQKCPFLNSCLYAHRLPDGTYFEYDRDYDQYKYNEFGEQFEDQEGTLADNFGL